MRRQPQAAVRVRCVRCGRDCPASEGWAERVHGPSLGVARRFGGAFRALLLLHFHVVTCAHTLTEGLDALAAKPDVVFLDVDLPDGNGITTMLRSKIWWIG